MHDRGGHSRADRRLAELAEDGRPWAVPWPCVHEFLAVVTHPRIYVPPSPAATAVKQVECWLECPSLHPIGETAEHWGRLKEAMLSGNLVGPVIHDARIVAICLQHGVKTLWSADRDFSRLAGLRIVNPLLRQ